VEVGAESASSCIRVAMCEVNRLDSE
jgi:hypothetical protein